jgi:hypothetical protein
MRLFYGEYRYGSSVRQCVYEQYRKRLKVFQVIDVVIDIPSLRGPDELSGLQISLQRCFHLLNRRHYLRPPDQPVDGVQ